MVLEGVLCNKHQAKTIQTNLLTDGDLEIYLYQSGSNFPKRSYSLYNSEQDWGTKKGQALLFW